jgi:hypothetical protein
VVDVAGGRDGTVRGSPAQGVPGVYGSTAFDFAGGDDNYVEVPDASGLRPARLSVGGWYRTDSGDTQQTLVQKADALFGDLGFGVEIQTGSSLRAHVAVDSGVARVNPFGLATQDGEWHHVCLTWDGEALRLYLDGQEVARDDSQSGDVDHTTRPLFVGCGDNGYTSYYAMEGRIDDVRLYDRPLTPSEVTAIVEGDTGDGETTTEEPTTTTTVEPPTTTTTETATPIPNDDFGDAGYGAYGYGGIT